MTMLKPNNFLAAVAAMLAIAMQVAPETAQSNLSSWLQLITQNSPELLKNPQMDNWSSGLLLFVALALFTSPSIGRWLRAAKRIPASSREVGTPSRHRLHLCPRKDFNSRSRKSYVVQWSPRTYFSMRFVEASNNSLGETKSDNEPTFYLLNAGPGAVRNVDIKWSFNDDIVKLINESNIFGSNSVEVNDTGITLTANGSAQFRPLMAEQVCAIPKINEDEVCELNAPEEFRWTWGVRMLAETKLFSEAIPLVGELSVVDLIHRTDGRQLFTLTIRFENESGIESQQVFDVHGWIFPHVSTHSFEKTLEGFRGEIEPNGVTAMVDNVVVTERAQTNKPIN